MDNSSEFLENLEKEYATEIRGGNVELEQFYAFGVTQRDFASEILLRKKYGDGILQGEKDNQNSGDKNIVKVNDNDILMSKTQMQQAEEIDEDPFNAELDALLVKLR